MSVSVTLEDDEALVLFDLVSRYVDSGELAIRDQAEQRVLWNLLATLESSLVSPFQSDYVTLLERARASLRDPP